MYHYGIGVEKNPKKAKKLYMKAANQGYEPSLVSLGVMYQYGAGVKKNLGKAAEFYQKAAKKGNVAAKTALKSRVFAEITGHYSAHKAQTSRKQKEDNFEFNKALWICEKEVAQIMSQYNQVQTASDAIADSFARSGSAPANSPSGHESNALLNGVAGGIKASENAKRQEIIRNQYYKLFNSCMNAYGFSK